MPLYRELQSRVLQKCLLPADFTNWESELELDEDEFDRFREQVHPRGGSSPLEP